MNIISGLPGGGMFSKKIAEKDIEKRNKQINVFFEIIK